MAVEHVLNYTGEELNALLASVEALANKIDNSMLTIDDDDNGKILRVVNGKWTADTLAVYNGEVID